MPGSAERRVCIYSPSFPESDKSNRYRAKSLEDLIASVFDSEGVKRYIATQNPDSIPQLLQDGAILAINGNSADYSVHHLVRELREKIPQTTAIIVFLEPYHHYLEGGCIEAGADIVFRCLPPQEIEHYERSVSDLIEIAKRNRFTVLTPTESQKTEEKAA